MSGYQPDLDALLADLSDATGEAQIDDIGNRFLALGEEHGEAFWNAVYRRRDELDGRLNDAKLRVAAVSAKLAITHLAITSPVDMRDQFSDRALAARGPSAEKVIAALLLLEHAHATVPIDEASVARALDPLRVPSFSDYSEVFAGSVALLRTAGYYVLDARDSYDALASDPPEQDTFPPLPFQRIWIETHEPGLDRPAPYLRFFDERDDRDESYRTLDVLGVGIVEVQRGEVWDIYVPFRFSGGKASFFFAERISPAGVIAADPEAVDAAGLAFAHVRRLAVGGVHLVTARNVPHEQLVLPRHQRKRIGRMGGIAPTIYYVNLAAGGEHDAHESGREYSVRWLVRGHWRHLDHGRATCTCCVPGRSASWVDPYIKGPVGAPWKGRAIHRAKVNAA